MLRTFQQVKQKKKKYEYQYTDFVQHMLTSVLMQDLFCTNSSTERQFLAV